MRSRPRPPARRRSAWRSQTDDRLLEFGAGALSPYTLGEMLEQLPFDDIWHPDDLGYDGEAIGAFWARTAAAAEDLVEAHGRTLVVSHAGTTMGLLRWALGIDAPSARLVRHPPAERQPDHDRGPHRPARPPAHLRARHRRQRVPANPHLVLAMYAPGHGEPMLSMLRARTASEHAAFFLPHLAPGQRLLDVGCSEGVLTRELAAHVAPGLVVGVDADPGITRAAAEAAASSCSTQVRFETALADDLPFPDGSFDRAFVHALFEHVR